LRNTSKIKAQLLEEISVLRSRVVELEEGTGESQKARRSMAGFDRIGMVNRERSITGRVQRTTYPQSGTSRVEKAVQETEVPFQLLFEDGTVPLVTLNSDLQLVRVNRAFCKLLGYTKQDLEGRTIKDLTHPDDAELSVAQTTQLFKKKRPSFQFENRYLTKSQTIIWCNVTASMARVREGTPTLIVVMIEDITARKRAEDTLRIIVEGAAAVTSADFFHSLLRYVVAALDAPYAFIAECVDATNTRVRTLVFLNKDRFVENVEYALKGTPCEEVITGKVCYHSQDLQRLFPRDMDLVELGVQSYIGLPLQHSSGKVIGHLVIMSQESVTFDAQTESLLTIFAARAGAELERKQAEEKLYESERRLRLTQFAVDHAADAIFWADDHQRVVYANEAACSSLGYSQEEMQGLTIADIASSHHQNTFRS